MFGQIFTSLFYNPIYNILVFLVDIIPGGDVGLAIIVTTILVKVVLIPLSVSAIKTQMAMKKIQPKLKELQEEFKDNKEEQAKEMLELYKKYNIKPFSTLLLFIIQIPIVVALYMVFRGEAFPHINTEILYSFVTSPVHLSLNFLGMFDITGKSIFLAAIAGITQFFQVKYIMPKPEEKKEGEEPSLKADFMKNMQMQMQYVMPIMMAVFAYVISGAVALYFITSNLFAISQELVLRRTVKKETD